MSAATLTPAQKAFGELADHCILCPGCKVDLGRPVDPPECPEAMERYRSWFLLWRREVRR
ncbi:hypothetical protein AB0H86_39490 [Streptomyces sp. NPDC050997]|uniref:hypothetical protein n=1 Tax=Streptomyces sp. NPDC050997 TaxID=3155519 RepID=UPI00344529D5